MRRLRKYKRLDSDSHWNDGGQNTGRPNKRFERLERLERFEQNREAVTRSAESTQD